MIEIVAQLVRRSAGEIPASRADLQRRVENLPNTGPTALWRELLHWHLTPRTARTVAPGSNLTTAALVRDLIMLGLPEGADEAADLLPGKQ